MKKILILFLSMALAGSAAGCSKNPPIVPDETHIQTETTPTEETLFSEDSYEDFSVDIYRCDDVYRTADTPTHGYGTLSLPMGQEVLTVRDFKILLCYDGCDPTDVLNRAFSGYAPVWRIDQYEEFTTADGRSFPTRRYSNIVPDEIKAQMIAQGAPESVTNPRDYLYLLTLDEIHYAYLHLKGREDTERLPNEAELADSMVKNSQIRYQPGVSSVGVVNPMGFINVISNDGGLRFRSVFLPVSEGGGYTDAIRVDDRHVLYLTYGKNSKDENGSYRKSDIHFYLIDTLEGAIAASAEYADEFTYSMADYTDNGIVLVDFDVVGKDETKVNHALRLDCSNGELTVESVQRETAYPYNEQRIVSPTGEYVVYEVVDDGYGRGGIEVRYANGERARILTCKSWWDAADAGYHGDAALGYVTGYSAAGFADDTHLVYTIGGYSGADGFGIIDLAAGENTEYTDSTYQLYVVGDGVVAFAEHKRNEEGHPEPYRIWSMTLDGTRTLLASTDETDDVSDLPKNMSNRGQGEPFFTFTEVSSKEVPDWFYHTLSYQVEAIYTADWKEKLAVIEYPSDGGYRMVRNIYFCEDSVTVVLPIEQSEEEGE